ncbi:D-threitol dehydrogenase [Agrobacterium rhizogenes]|uniref:GolD/DthD family dehydrogenase n=1 Tax=Rhizobium rhizogenes TaxID=359 RepID=UPI001572793A|nr:D-threitol dehydrogenase [Rhizobium rhizogenes]NTF52805.1 D-threitol dehydrogenase [Rhizobium rhizogenes]NTG04724.1 D-threitol dehydrogenase [Rhizobium rhizogenes]NTG25138.1 D-threitol dehydrogenase [Rhizobium rhizogenes]NTG31912.1 D-threitol dehydrogenase [Rhizobium rhizogenes]NTG38940.1 D-threitol dehydrogenase [Rhizobium rhizogenes]
MNDLTFDKLFDLTNHVAVITGAANGIGTALAEVFVERGATVALIDRDQRVHQVAEQLGERSYGFVCDISDEAQVQITVAAIATALGRIDILINNAGIGSMIEASELSLAEWSKVISVNLTGQFIVTKAVAPHMFAREWGRILCMSSQASIIGIEGHTAYSASKTALLGMVRCMAIEWAPKGITVNAISPTIVETEMSLVGWSGEKGARARKEIPVGRFAKPHEVAYAALFLCSDASAMINGINLPVDGGYTVR